MSRKVYIGQRSVGLVQGEQNKRKTNGFGENVQVQLVRPSLEMQSVLQATLAKDYVLRYL